MRNRSGVTHCLRSGRIFSIELRAIVLSTACALAFCSVAPCDYAQGARIPHDAARITPPGTYPIVKDSITLSAIAPTIGFVKNWKTNSSAIWRQKLTNVKVEWIETTRIEAKAKLSIMLASGDYADVIFGMNNSGLSVQDLSRYGKEGIFLPLNGLIDEYGYEVKELFKEEPEVRKAITSPDGNIYALPLVATDDYHLTLRQKLWINKAWLDKLGLALPTTTDEFYTVMKAFKQRDPNGNGLADEIPMTGAKRSQEDLAMWIMNAFVIAGGPDESGDATLNCYEFIVNDQVFFNANTDEFKEGLKYLRKLFKEGLIDVAALTQDKAQIKSLVDGGTVRVGAVASHHPGNFCTLTDDMTAPMHQFVVLPPLKGPKGNRTTPWIIDQAVAPGQFVITNKCRHPVVAFRWGDSFFNLDATLVDKGVEGLHWFRVDPSEKVLGMNGKQAKYRYGKVLSQDDNAQIGFGPGWTRDLKNEFAIVPGKFSYEEFLYRSTKAYDPFKVRRYPYTTAPIAESDSTEFNDLRRTIHTYIGESVDRFIIGDLDIDRKWDAYAKQLDQIGLQRYLQILRAAYASSSR